MHWAVDLLASEYGWSKKEIYEEVYLDELYSLQSKIKSRKMSEHRIHLAIVQNPHTKDPNALVKVFEEEEKKNMGLREEKLDKDSLMRLKEQLSTSKTIRVK